MGLPPWLESDGLLVAGDDKLAGIMNNFFVDKVKRIRAGIDEGWQRQQQGGRQQQQRKAPPSFSSTPPASPLAASSSSSFSLDPPAEKDVLRAIRKLKNTPALGEDGIPTRILKDLAPVHAAPLTHLARRSFDTARVPDLFKIANVVPILKKGKDATKPASYRPIALLTSMSKVLESLVLQQFTPHLASRLPAEQWAFCRARSTTAALATAQGH